MNRGLLMIWLIGLLLMSPSTLTARDALSGPTAVPPGYTGVQTTSEEAAVQPINLKEKMNLTEQFGQQIPLDLVFLDHRGRTVILGECLSGNKAVILNLVYYNCPSICNELMNTMVDALRNLPWKVGDQFQILTVSIDPREGPFLAARKRQSYLDFLGQYPAHEDWLFLTAAPESGVGGLANSGHKENTNIQLLADSVGFDFVYQEDIDQYAHPAVTMLLAPDGRVMRYLEGLYIAPLDLKLGLIDAGEGQVGNTIDRALLRWCYAYDPRNRGYSMKIKQVMMGGGALTVLLVGSFMFFLWRREIRTGGIT